MEKIITAIDKNIKKDESIIATTVIEGESNIVYSTENWDIRRDINKINSVWGSQGARDITIAEKEYKILQNTDEKLIAVSIEKSRRGVVTKEGIVGFRDEERTIICKVPENGILFTVLMNTARTLSEISSKQPYIPDEISLEKKEADEELTPKIISDTSRILEKLGLHRVGLSEDDAKVYIALLGKGEKGEKVGNLDKELDLKRTHIYRIIDRLIQKDWVDKLAKTPKGGQLYAARPIVELLDDFIKEKEEEIKILKGLKLIISENLENGWKIITDSKKDLKSQFDLDIQEIMGNEKDCGIVIYEYDRIIKGEENLDKVKLRIYSKKLETTIKERKEIGKLKDLKDVKVDEIDILDYCGAEISVIYKKGSETANNVGEDWNIVAKLVSIPIDNKIYIIWGSEGKFQILMDMILKIG
ncbi:hypothetical protein LCGC14_0639240 [marine sediment metagenome]|uniref:Transcription regulator TrmB N-terminal domain-containing protein n=1 Tax=marine sediment metagenome TaxID=412755 RepID=A0A0F9U824_9ZZZZ